MSGRLLGLILVFTAVFGWLLTAQSTQALASGNPKYASFVMDADTGLVLHQRYADKKLHPASLTKVMTLYMVFEALERGTLRLNDRVRISNHAASMVPSKLDLPAGSSIRVKDAIYALVTKSANDVAAALGEHLGGTEENFARMMTRKAHHLGMKSTTFRNASGLHHPRQISTARDMARLAQIVINTYPDYYRYFSRQSFTYKGKTYRNHNRLMKSYAGMDGMKTGYINASGFNLISSAVRNNRRLIGVVFGGRTGRTRNAHMAKILDSSFAKLNDIRLASAQVPLPPRKPNILMALASLNKLNPAGGVSNGVSGGDHNDDINDGTKWAMLNPALKNGMFSRLIGEGDYDPAVSRRIETGLIAIAAHKEDSRAAQRFLQSQQDQLAAQNIRQAAYSNQDTYRPQAHNQYQADSWAIQVGAFTSRAATDRAIMKTLRTLPRRYAHAKPLIAPFKSGEEWLFRARLGGYSKEEAFAACKVLRDCIPVAP